MSSESNPPTLVYRIQQQVASIRLESNPQILTDGTVEQVLEFFRSRIPTTDMSTHQYEHELCVLVRAFVPTIPSRPPERQAFYVVVFASQIPNDLRDEEYACAITTFEYELDRWLARDPTSLTGERLGQIESAFVDGLPYDDHFDGSDTESWNYSNDLHLPRWFQIDPIVLRDPDLPPRPFSSFVEPRAWLEDLDNLNGCLRDIFPKIEGMVRDGSHGDAEASTVLTMLNNAADQMDIILLPSADHPFTTENIVELGQGFVVSENIMLDVIEALVRAEQILIRRENEWATSGTEPLKLALSRYERSRFRVALKAECIDSRLERFRNIIKSFPTFPRPEPITRDDRDTEDCPICAEELPERGVRLQHL